MTTWILERTDCPGKQIHNALLLSSRLFLVNEWTLARLERFPHKGNTNIILGQAREISNPDFHLFERFKNSGIVISAEEWWPHLRRQFRVKGVMRQHVGRFELLRVAKFPKLPTPASDEYPVTGIFGMRGYQSLV